MKEVGDASYVKFSLCFCGLTISLVESTDGIVLFIDLVCWESVRCFICNVSYVELEGCR